MQWLKKHQFALKKIIDDIRLSPNRRLLGELLLLWIEADTEEEKKFLYKIIENEYSSPTKSVKKEEDEFNSKRTQAEIEAAETLKQYFTNVKEENEVLTTDLHTTD